jgi:hypothetical protein
MKSLEDVYKTDPVQKEIDEGAGWGAEQMLKAGVPIYYRSEDYPETLEGNLFVKEYPNGAKMLIKTELTADYRVLEEQLKLLNG